MGFDIKAIGSSIQNAVGMAELNIKRVSPEICLGLGIATMVGAVISGVIAARNHDKIISEHEEALEEAKAETVIEEEEIDGEIVEVEVERDKKEINRAVRKVYFKTLLKFGKNYAITAALLGIALFSFCEMHHIQAGRILGLEGVVTSCQEYIKRYEDNNRKLNGEESHRMCKYGFKEVEVEEEDENGEKVKKTKFVCNDAEDIAKEYGLEKEAKVRDCFHEAYAIFSKQTSYIYNGRASWDKMSLENAQSTRRDRLKARGWVLLNEALVMLGLEPTLEGMVEGWVKDVDEEPDFGIEDPVNNKFLAGFNDQPVFLSFNVGSNVYNYLKRKEERDLMQKKIVQENGVLYCAEGVNL